MGVALIIPGDFSADGKNIGKVTFQQNVALASLTINSNANYSGQSFTPAVTYTPLTTNQKGVTWSITSGGTYATIDATTGLVTILSNASANSITIEAVSTADNTVMATATTSVTYVSTPILPTSLTISGNASYSGQSTQYTVSYTPSTTNQTGVTWNITSGETYATIDSTTGILIILSAANASQVVIRATSTTATSVYAEKTLTLTYEVAQIGRKIVLANPYISASATDVDTTNPISNIYINTFKTLAGGYVSGNFKDTTNLDWFSYITHSNAASILSTYVTTPGYTEIDMGLGFTGNGYSNISGLTNDTGYALELFAGNSQVEYSSVKKGCKPLYVCTNVPAGTYQVKLWFNRSSADDLTVLSSGKQSFIANSLVTILTKPATLLTPITITGITPDSNGNLLLAMGNEDSVNEINIVGPNFIEITRTA